MFSCAFFPSVDQCVICAFVCTRLGPVDIDPTSYTTQELKKALAKMKKSLNAEDTLEEKVLSV